MNNDAELIRAALDRRFGRVHVPACPERAWRGAATVDRPRGISRRFAYAAALLGVVAIAGLTAQASTVMATVQQSYVKLVGPMFVSSKPLTRIIHAADQLTVAEVQRRVPFPIVMPAGLPANTQLLYATFERPAHVTLMYQAHVTNRYYRIAIGESTVAGPSVAHFEAQRRGGPVKKWTLPLRRWKHGAVFMSMPDWALPPAMGERIARANTM